MEDYSTPLTGHAFQLAAEAPRITASADDTRTIICIPIFNDWECATILLSHIDQALSRHGLRASVLLVDDGSTDEVSDSLPHALRAITEVEVLRLRRNVGHQRAIALGLTFIYAQRPCRAVIVMDGDGEDSPEDCARLLQRFEEHGGKRVVFAQRSRRSEGIVFRLFYVLYKLAHRLLTGHSVEVGNFSVIPRAALERLVGVSELWNHYAASVFKARLPVSKVPTARAMRLQGQSKMNFVSLVTHGLSAISVFGEQVYTRLLVATSVLGLSTLLGLLAVVGIRLATNLAVPGWATSAAGSLLTVLLSAVLLSLVFVVSMLQARSSATFLPIRDYQYYVSHVQSIAARDSGNPDHGSINQQNRAEAWRIAA